MIAGQWGDNAAPGTTITYPDCIAFLQSILTSNEIQCASLCVIQRWPFAWQQTETLPASQLFGPKGYFGPGVLGNLTDPARALKIEFVATLFIPSVSFAILPNAQKPLNVAQFKAQWDAASAPADKLQLITATWPGINIATYESNLTTYLANLTPATPDPGGAI